MVNAALRASTFASATLRNRHKKRQALATGCFPGFIGGIKTGDYQRVQLLPAVIVNGAEAVYGGLPKSFQTLLGLRSFLPDPFNFVGQVDLVQDRPIQASGMTMAPRFGRSDRPARGTAGTGSYRRNRLIPLEPFCSR